MRKTLGPAFFNRPTLTVARELLGKYLVRRVGDKTIALVITETEAYDGPRDKASHAHRGRTPRNEPMFGPAGRTYIYFTYGIHWLLNIVCGATEYPAGVLIRGAGDLIGPARVTKFLAIDGTQNAQQLTRKLGLWIEDRGVKVLPCDVSRKPRVGIAYAEEYVHKPWRFILKPTQKSRYNMK